MPDERRISISVKGIREGLSIDLHTAVHNRSSYNAMDQSLIASMPLARRDNMSAVFTTHPTSRLLTNDIHCHKKKYVVLQLMIS